jgi:hypothetical protein
MDQDGLGGCFDQMTLLYTQKLGKFGIWILESFLGDILDLQMSIFKL